MGNTGFLRLSLGIQWEFRSSHWSVRKYHRLEVKNLSCNPSSPNDEQVVLVFQILMLKKSLGNEEG